MHYPKNDFVITSRPHGYRSTPIDGATVLQVRSFTDRQVQAFVRGWYSAVERHTADGSTDEIQRRADAAADDLLSRLFNSPALVDLSVNPLLLTMISNVHRYRGALPDSRAELYNEICQVMLWRRQEAKKLPSDLGGEKKERLLATLAFAMMQRRIRDLSTKEILTEIRATLRRISRKVTASEFLLDVGSNGLLVERENGEFSFAHHTFQEYLAASHVLEKDMVSTLAKHVEDAWWRETTLLYAAQADNADAIVEACLVSGTVTALSLAFDCSEQARKLDPDLNERLERLIAEALATGAEPARRKLAAAVLVTRHLRQMARTGANGQVAMLPITRKIYHLFRQDVPGPPPDSPGLFTPDNRPATGVRRRDAIAFTHWVNEQISGEQEYRLPTTEEITDPAVQRLLGGLSQCVWLHSDRFRPVLWTPREGVDPLAVEIRTQITFVTSDIRLLDNILSRFFTFYAIATSRQPNTDDIGLQAEILARDLTHDRLDLLYAPNDRGIVTASTPPSDTELMTISNLSKNAESELISLLPHVRERIHDAAVRFATGGERPGHGELTELLGFAIPMSIARSLLDPNFKWPTAPMYLPAHTSTHEFGREFIELTRAGTFRHVVDLDGLADLTKGACQLLHMPIDGRELSSWTIDVANNFTNEALPVFQQEKQLTPAKATALRFIALCLASEADALDKKATGDQFRAIAAGLTLLERRANGDAPATETIVLAIA